MKLKYVLFALTVLCIHSCKKIIETQPKDAIDLNTSINQPDVLAGFINAIYHNMQGSGYYGRDFIVGPELMGDNQEITSQNSNRLVNQANNTPPANIGQWQNNYSNIYRANLVIKYADASTATDAEKKRLKGEAYFLRALNYFDAVKAYARNPQFASAFEDGVPIVTDPVIDAKQATYPARSKVSEVYTLILSDLDQAIALLNNDNTPVRANKTAALALASRVNLYKGDWNKAESFATQALASGVGSFVNDSAGYVKNWGGAHPESIFELNFEEVESNGSNSIWAFNFRDAVFSNYGDATGRLGLINAMDTTNDKIRYKGLIIRTVKFGTTQPVYYTRKFQNAKGAYIDDIMLIRVSELYLNRAEARALKSTPDIIGALADVNKVRTRGGYLQPLTGLTGTALVDAIRNERRIELAYEGHRLWDLLRYGQDFIKTNGTVNPTSLTIPFSSNYLYAPIPQTERDVNPNLSQNPGY